MITLQELGGLVEYPAERSAHVDLIRKQVIADFSAKTGRVWAATSGLTYIHECSDLVDRDASICIWQPNMTVVSVEEWDRSDPSDIETLDEFASGEGDYTIDVADALHTIIRRVSDRWADYVRITYDCGYDSLPDSLATIKLAVAEQISFIMERYQQGKRIVSSQSFDAGSTSYIRGPMCDLYREAISTYRSPM